MRKYLVKDSIKPWKVFLFFQLLGWILVLLLLILMQLVLPKFFIWALIALIALPYVIYSVLIFWVNTGNPKVSITSALAKLWCIIYFLYGMAVLVRIGTNA